MQTHNIDTKSLAVALLALPLSLSSAVTHAADGKSFTVPATAEVLGAQLYQAETPEPLNFGRIYAKDDGANPATLRINPTDGAVAAISSAASSGDSRIIAIQGSSVGKLVVQLGADSDNAIESENIVLFATVVDYDKLKLSTLIDENSVTTATTTDDTEYKFDLKVCLTVACDSGETTASTGPDGTATFFIGGEIMTKDKCGQGGSTSSSCQYIAGTYTADISVIVSY